MAENGAKTNENCIGDFSFLTKFSPKIWQTEKITEDK